MNDLNGAPAPSQEPTGPSTVVTVELTLAEIDTLLSLRYNGIFMPPDERANYVTARDQLNDAYNAATGHDSEEYRQ